MKKKLMSFIMSAVLVIIAIPVMIYAADGIDGTYEGWYYANQGQTGLTLTIKDGEGVFEFYNMPGKSNAKDGSYTVKVSETTKGYKIEGVEWIEKPSGYGFVSLEGTFSGDTFEGTVSNNSSWKFVLMKNNEQYQQISESVYNNHKYEVFDEGLTWKEAKAKCEEMGGYLATITSNEEQKQIENLLNDREKNAYWIGGTKSNDEWMWITGEEWDYTNWCPYQPDGYEDGSDYLQIINNADSRYIAGAVRYSWQDITNTNESGNRKYFSTENVGYICEWETWTESAQWATPELEKAAEYGLIPDVLIAKDMTQPITRGEFAAVCVKLYESMTGGRAVMSSECKFEDISSNENRNYILKAYNIGAVLGISENQYAPDMLLSREQLATMLTRVYKKCEWPDWTINTDDNYTINYSGVQKFADDAEISEYAKPSVYFMVKYNVLSGIGDNKFAPKNTTPAQEAAGYANATREQAIAMSLRSFENLR